MRTPRLRAPSDFLSAHEAWGANCGPGALAAILGLDLSNVRQAFPGFPDRSYTTLTTMLEAIRIMGHAATTDRPRREDRKVPALPYGLCQVQWTGPWTAPGANPRWAYTHTHWVGLAVDQRGAAMVYDINSWDEEAPNPDAVFGLSGGGWTPVGDWERDVVAGLTSEIKWADGGWYVRATISVELGR